MIRGSLVALGLFVLVLAVYWPVRGYEFLDLDDPDNVSGNLMVLNGLTPDGLFQAARTSHPDYWRPLTWLSYMIDTEFYRVDRDKPDPLGYHLTNIVLHAIGTVMLLGALNALTGAFWRSALVAAIFAVHPLRVESVAW